MMFRFRSTVYRFGLSCLVQDTNGFVILGICEHELKFTFRGNCIFTLSADYQNTFN